MSIISAAAIVICVAYILVQLVFLLVLRKLRSPLKLELENYPTVSVLVAARNEASNIIRCLQSLDALEYPEGKIEIIIGNDLSTDYTKMLTEGFIKNKSKFRLINLTGKEHPNTKGKARVLATLAEAAKGDYYLITDADIRVNPDWAKAMVATMVNGNAGMCGGTTDIEATTLFGKYQRIDWLYFMSIIHAMASIGKNLTVVGNNTGISASAYKSTGGYGQIPFSITEDYALYKAVKDAGYKVLQYPNPETVVYSHPLDSIKGVLKQRKRWMTGGWELPIYYHLMMFVFGAWYFALPVLLFTHLPLAICLTLIKDFIQLFQIMTMNTHLKRKEENVLQVLTYDLYLFVMIPITAVYFLLPLKNSWKGRTY